MDVLHIILLCVNQQCLYNVMKTIDIILHFQTCYNCYIAYFWGLRNICGFIYIYIWNKHDSAIAWCVNQVSCRANKNRDKKWSLCLSTLDNRNCFQIHTIKEIRHCLFALGDKSLQLWYRYFLWQTIVPLHGYLILISNFDID